MTTTADDLLLPIRDASQRIAQETARRDAAIREALAFQCSTASVARAADLDRATVRKINERAHR